MNLELTSTFKLANETYIVMNPQWDNDTSKLNDAEYIVVEALQLHKRLKIQEISQIMQHKTVLPFIKKMQELKLVSMEEEVYERYRPKITKMIRLCSDLNPDSALERLKTSHVHLPGVFRSFIRQN